MIARMKKSLASLQGLLHSQPKLIIGDESSALVLRHLQAADQRKYLIKCFRKLKSDNPRLYGVLKSFLNNQSLDSAQTRAALMGMVITNELLQKQAELSAKNLFKKPRIGSAAKLLLLAFIVSVLASLGTSIYGDSSQAGPHAQAAQQKVIEHPAKGPDLTCNSLTANVLDKNQPCAVKPPAPAVPEQAGSSKQVAGQGHAPVKPSIPPAPPAKNPAATIPLTATPPQQPSPSPPAPTPTPAPAPQAAQQPPAPQPPPPQPAQQPAPQPAPTPPPAA